jgi:hypothetical protein
MFQNQTDSKPISIIITTLAANAYSGETDDATALINILEGMEKYIRNQHPRVPNPVDPGEDFADRWRMAEYKHLKLESYFRLWLTQAKQDFRSLFARNDTSFISSLAEQKFSTKVNREILYKHVQLSQVIVDLL